MSVRIHFASFSETSFHELKKQTWTKKVELNMRKQIIAKRWALYFIWKNISKEIGL